MHLPQTALNIRQLKEGKQQQENLLQQVLKKPQVYTSHQTVLEIWDKWRGKTSSSIIFIRLICTEENLSEHM